MVDIIILTIDFLHIYFTQYPSGGEDWIFIALDLFT